LNSHVQFALVKIPIGKDGSGVGVDSFALGLHPTIINKIAIAIQVIFPKFSLIVISPYHGTLHLIKSVSVNGCRLFT
jgi:hypothetical protein